MLRWDFKGNFIYICLMDRKNFGVGFVTIQPNKEYTKDPMSVADLSDNGVFVFGSNTEGQHYVL